MTETRRSVALALGLGLVATTAFAQSGDKVRIGLIQTLSGPAATLSDRTSLTPTFTAPDGTQTADTVTDSSAAAFQQVFQDVTVANGKVETYRVKMKLSFKYEA